MAEVRIVRMNNRGQFVMPVEFRRILGLEKDSEVQMALMKDGAVEIRPVTHIPKSLLLERSDKLRKKVLDAYDAVKGSKTISEEEVNDLVNKK